MSVSQLLIGLAFANIMFAGSWKDIQLELTAERSEIVMGEPLIALFNVRNNSNQQINMFFDDRDLTLVSITDERGTIVKLPPQVHTLDHMSFGQGIPARTQQRITIAITETTESHIPGRYLVQVIVAGISASLPVVVEPSDAGILDAWMEKTSRLITNSSNLGEQMELVKALASIKSETSEKYVCRIASSSEDLSIPEAINRLEKISNLTAARCLVQSFLNYTDKTNRVYVKAALDRMQASDDEIRSLVQQSIKQ